MTQEQLAEQLFVSRTAVSKWESGRGYPNIESLKAISKLFSVSIDKLLSGDELITVAEAETKEKTRNIKTMVFSILDCMAILILFLPLFGQQGQDMIEKVSLLALSKAPSYIKIPYIIWVAATTLWGIVTLVLQSSQNRIWVKSNTKISLTLSVFGVIGFIASNQPYAAILIFFILLLKVFLLLKR